MDRPDRYKKAATFLNDVVYNACFDDRRMKKTIMAPMPDLAVFNEERIRIRTIPNVAPRMKPLYAEPLLTKVQEDHLFRKMNYIKYHAKKLFDTIEYLDRKKIIRVEKYINQAKNIKNQIAASNFRLITKLKLSKFGDSDFEDKMSESYIVILRSVDLFDYSRGWKFNTYAMNALFNKSIRDYHYKTQYESRLEPQLGTDVELGDLKILYDNGFKNVDDSESVSKLLESLKECDPRDTVIVKGCYGLGEDKKTLEEMGTKLKVSKERVRQIRDRCVLKMRERATKLGIA